MTVKFNDPETGKELRGTLTDERTIQGQTWQLVIVQGVYWAVPTGWPNNASPICEESDPAAYAEIAG